MGYKNGKELEKLLPTFSFLTEVSLVEGMKKLMPIYHVLGKIPFVYAKFMKNVATRSLNLA